MYLFFFKSWDVHVTLHIKDAAVMCCSGSRVFEVTDVTFM